MIKHIRPVPLLHGQLGWMILGLATCSCVARSFRGTGKVCVVLFASRHSQLLPSRCCFSPLLGTVFYLTCPCTRSKSCSVHTDQPWGSGGQEDSTKCLHSAALWCHAQGQVLGKGGAGGQRSTRPKPCPPVHRL